MLPRKEFIEEGLSTKSLFVLVEIPPLHGAAHIIEHLVARDLLPLVEQEGFTFSAETGLGSTLYQITGTETPSQTLLHTIYNSIFSKEITLTDFEKEKNVVIQEIKKDLEDSNNTIGERFYEIFLGSSVLGTIEEIQTLSFEEMQRNYKGYYVVGNVVIVTNIKGAFTKEIFSLIPPGKKEVSLKCSYGSLELKEDLLRAHYLRIYFCLNQPYNLLLVLAEILQKKMFNVLSKQKGMVYDVSCWADLHTHSFNIDFSADTKSATEVKHIIEGILKEDITKEEFLQVQKVHETKKALERTDPRKRFYSSIFLLKFNETANKEFTYEDLYNAFDNIRKKPFAELMLSPSIN